MADFLPIEPTNRMSKWQIAERLNLNFQIQKEAFESAHGPATVDYLPVYPPLQPRLESLLIDTVRQNFASFAAAILAATGSTITPQVQPGRLDAAHIEQINQAFSVVDNAI